MGRIFVIETGLDYHTLTAREETNAIVIHHTGADLDPDAATIHDWHKQKGWNGCGYHYIIRKDGSVERGRPEWSVGSHAYGRNQDTVGVHVGGEFTGNQPTPAQLDSLTALLADLCEQYGLEPGAAIIGHRDTPTPTECPGDILYSMLPEIREDVSALLSAQRGVNRMRKKVTDTINKAGHKIDDWVEEKSVKHRFTKPQVWLAVGIAALAVVGAAKLMGLL